MAQTNQAGGRLAHAAGYILLGAYLTASLTISLTEPLLFLSVALWIVLLALRRDWRLALPRLPCAWPVLAFVLVVLVCSACGVRPAASFRRVHRLLFLGVIFAVPQVFGDFRKGLLPNAVSAAHCLVAGACLLAVYDLIRVPLLVRAGTSLYDTGNMRDPQLYMAALCFSLAALFASARGRRRWLWGLAVVLCAAGLVIHFKRGVWLATFAVTLCGAVLARRWAAAAAAILCVALLLAAPPVRARLGMLREEGSLMQGGRLALWTEVAPKLLKAHPWGMGFCATRHEDFTPHTRYVQPKLDHLHNNAVQVAVELGWIGLAVWVWWMAAAIMLMIRNCRRSRTREGDARWLAAGALMAFLGLMGNGLVEYNFGDSEILMLMNLVVGLSAAVHVVLRTMSGDGSSPTRGIRGPVRS